MIWSRHGKQESAPGTPVGTPEACLEELCREIAGNLYVDVERIRYARLDRPSKIGSVGHHWQVYWRGEWHKLPWHFDGPTHVTWDMIRQWYGIASTTGANP